MARLFGTDGVRGVAGTELDAALAMRIGMAAATVLTKAVSHRPRIVIGKDTRISSDMLESALAAGLCSVGADVLRLGVVPTPAVAYLVNQYDADAGVMISASHNPMEYNGIKLFSGEGYKLSDALEDEIEAIVRGKAPALPPKTGAGMGRQAEAPHAVRDYVRHLMGLITTDLSGLRVAVDCANGSASVTAPLLFAGLRGDCEILNAQPDGTNINHDCGSTHIESLRRFVVENRCDLGVAFDGDADRCLAVDETGALIDGDKLIAIFAKNMKQRGLLPGDTAVVTVLSNLGFFRFAEENGIQVETTRVGDRYVLEAMREHGYAVGGEQSGHIIFLHDATTGDGELTAIRLIEALKTAGGTASRLASVMRCYPQVMVNVPVEESAKERLANDDAIDAAVAGANSALAGDGRVLVRASGTEPLVRVMIEGKDETAIRTLADGIAEVVKTRLGV